MKQVPASLRCKALVQNYSKFGAGQSIGLIKFIEKFSWFNLSFGASESLDISVKALKEINWN